MNPAGRAKAGAEKLPRLQRSVARKTPQGRVKIHIKIKNLAAHKAAKMAVVVCRTVKSLFLRINGQHLD